MRLVADTQSLLWFFYDSKRLSPRARAAFREAESEGGRIFVPAVVVAEAIMVVQKGRLAGVSLEHFVAQLEAMPMSSNYELCPLLPGTVLDSLALRAIPDIFDRLIGAEAMVRGLPLVSSDPVFRELTQLKVVWD